MTNLVIHLIDAAREINKDEPLTGCSFKDFCDIMWSDDHELRQWKVTRDEYRAALREAYDIIKS